MLDGQTTPDFVPFSMTVVAKGADFSHIIGFECRTQEDEKNHPILRLRSSVFKAIKSTLSRVMISAAVPVMPFGYRWPVHRVKLKSYEDTIGSQKK